MATSDNVGDNLNSDVPGRTALIETTYKEVLDATKHQDDKIGRLFTGIAFLTAAAMALAGLGSAIPVTKDFDMTPHELPLALIALGLYLVGVVFTVVLLVAGLATPLRLPGLAPSPPPARIPWVKSTSARASQLYFYEIAGVSLEEWRAKWSATPMDLEKERLHSYIRETHNLAVRTHFKYDRTTEAIAVFSLSLMSFALAVVLVLFAAAADTTPVKVGLWLRGSLAAVLAIYCFVQIVARLRYSRQTIEEAVGLGEGRRPGVRAWAERLYAVFLPTAVAVIVVAGKPQGRHWAVLAVPALAGLSYISFWVATISLPEGNRYDDVDTRSAARSKARIQSQRLRQRLITFLVIGVLTVVACVALKEDNYVLQLTISYLAAAALIGPSLFGPSLSSATSRRRYLDRMENRGAPEADLTGSDTAPSEKENPGGTDHDIQ